MSLETKAFVLYLAAIYATIGRFAYPLEIGEVSRNEKYKPSLPGLVTGTGTLGASGTIKSVPARKSNSTGRIANFLLAGAQKAGTLLCMIDFAVC